MKQSEIKNKLEKHLKWLNNDPNGEKADFTDVILTDANLTGANLRNANFTNANLTGANFTNVNFTNVNFTNANLTYANLTGANLTGANLRNANLTDVILTGAILDFSAWPLHCGSLKAKAGDRLLYQLLYHVASLDVSNCSKDLRNQFEALVKNNKAMFNGFCNYRSDIPKI
jgi:uncharacterized protein YjbI with pentapeptide repeats